MFYNVVHSIMLYGAPIWHKYLAVKTHGRYLTKAQRKFLIRMASAYRTVSVQAVYVITGVPPIELLAEEQNINHDNGEILKTSGLKNAKKRSKNGKNVGTLTSVQHGGRNNPQIDGWLNWIHRTWLVQVLYKENREDL